MTAKTTDYSWLRLSVNLFNHIILPIYTDTDNTTLNFPLTAVLLELPYEQNMLNTLDIFPDSPV